MKYMAEATFVRQDDEVRGREAACCRRIWMGR